jgi:hypothetical protein
MSAYVSFDTATSALPLLASPALNTLTINHDIICATADLHSDCFMRELQRCRHC